MRWADFDRAGTAAIRALPQFAGRTVNIYAIEGDALQGVITSIQAADSADYYVLNTLGAEIIGVPWPNIATVVVLIARRWGPSYDKFENSLTNYLQSDSEDPPVELFQQIYRLAHTILERESMRPTRFYLVTTSDRQPKALALLGTKRDDAGNTMVVPTTEAGSMRAIFDAIAKKWFGRLQQSLAAQSSPRETARDALLRQVWPEVPQER